MKLIIEETKPSQTGRLWSLKARFYPSPKWQNGHQRKSGDRKTELGHSDHLSENSGRASARRRAEAILAESSIATGQLVPRLAPGQGQASEAGYELTAFCLMTVNLFCYLLSLLLGSYS